MSDTQTAGSSGNQVATQGQPQGSTAVAAFDYGSYAHAGFENSKPTDFKPSFLRVLSGSSPELETVPGARPGLIINTVTKDLAESVLFVPAVREHVYVAWKPRTADGGTPSDSFGGVFQDTSMEVVASLKGFKKFEKGDDGKIIVPHLVGTDYDLIETVYFHGVQVLADGTLIPASMSFYSTGLSVADNWYTSMYLMRIPGTDKAMPLFAHVSKLATLKTEKGTFRWYNFAPSWANGNAAASRLDPSSNIFKAAAAVYDAWKAGHTDIDYAAGASNQSNASDTKADEEVPF